MHGIYPMLVVDAGNSSAKFAVVESKGATPKILPRIPNAGLSHRKVSALWKKSRALTACAACVVPATARILREACPGIRLIGARAKLDFRMTVERRTVGADRLANMAEAARRFGRCAIVCDFGTAATFDVLDGSGQFAGGAIAPGLRAMALVLHEKTARLPQILPSTPTRFAGRNTREALMAGVAGGYAGLVRHLVASLVAEQAPAMRKRAGRKRSEHALVFTGGDAAKMRDLSGLRAIIDPLWTLRGISRIGETLCR